jgi:hypothetical protein
MNKIVPLLLFVFLLACNNKEKENHQTSVAPKVTGANGYVVPKDSMAAPKVIAVDETKLKKNTRWKT